MQVLNDELDYLSAAIQQLEAEIERSVRLAPADVDSKTILPNVTERAGRAIAFDSNGDLTAVLPNELQGSVGAASTKSRREPKFGGSPPLKRRNWHPSRMKRSEMRQPSHRMRRHWPTSRQHARFRPKTSPTWWQFTPLFTTMQWHRCMGAPARWWRRRATTPPSRSPRPPNAW